VGELRARLGVTDGVVVRLGDAEGDFVAVGAPPAQAVTNTRVAASPVSHRMPEG